MKRRKKAKEYDVKFVFIDEITTDEYEGQGGSCEED